MKKKFSNVSIIKNLIISNYKTIMTNHHELGNSCNFCRSQIKNHKNGKTYEQFKSKIMIDAQYFCPACNVSIAHVHFNLVGEYDQDAFKRNIFEHKKICNNNLCGGHYEVNVYCEGYGKTTNDNNPVSFTAKTFNDILNHKETWFNAYTYVYNNN